jgi:hypothetical protein
MKYKFNQKEHTDSGLALLLMLLLIGLIWHLTLAFKFSVVCVLIIMIKPLLFYPFTFIWLNISDLLGKIFSKIFLVIIYFFFVVPVAGIRRIMGKDTLKLRQFKKSSQSAFFERNHKFKREDILNPF